MRRYRVTTLLLALPALSLASSANFLDYRDYLMAGTPEALAIADLNHDGIPDAVVATGNGTQVLMGAAGGSFRPAVTVDRNFATALAIADFNNDGNPDIVAAILTNGSQLEILL